MIQAHHTYGALYFQSNVAVVLTGGTGLWPAAAAAAKLLQSCPTLCNPIDGSPPGSPVPGILQATTRVWPGGWQTLSYSKY